MDRRELGEAIASRFDGAITYFDRHAQPRKKDSRRRYRSTAVLDWSTLHPVERLELLTTHDLARQEKQKLELLRHLLTYYQYAASESREDVLRQEINRVRSAVGELRDRYRTETEGPQRKSHHEVVPGGPVDIDTESADAQTQILRTNTARHASPEGWEPTPSLPDCRRGRTFVSVVS